MDIQFKIGDMVQWPHAKGNLKHGYGIVVGKSLYDITIQWFGAPVSSTYGVDSYSINHLFKVIS